jgi:chorismate-pyruvate lyase
MTITPSRRATPELKALANLFYLSLDELGEFIEVSPDEIPAAACSLLWHDQHMTVTVETCYDGPVDVRVLNTHITNTHYSRRIVLTPHRDRSPLASPVVLYGIVRLSLELLTPEVRREIEVQQTPLGRILIQNNVLRHVRLLSLWRVTPAADLSQLFELASTERCYGRTALIYCDGLPAVELLEIVKVAGD